MAEARVRSGLWEYVWIGGLLLMAGAALWAAGAGRTTLAAPTLVFVLIALAGYAVYRWQWQPGTPDERPVLWSGAADVTLASFRVIEVDGACPRGFGVGDRITLGRSGALSPVLCDHAAAALRKAAGDANPGVQQWCCPVQDHRLIFEREFASV
jgi:hypothetical protein